MPIKVSRHMVAVSQERMDELKAAEAQRDRYFQLLRWYVDSNLVDAGDEFGAWDDAVHQAVEP